MADHAAWLLSQLALAPPSIWVDSPLEEGGGFSKYVTYAVNQPSHSVRHRYSNFEKLRATLHARYGSYGVLVPSLPKKNVVLKGAGFHFQRMRGLQLFCEKIAKNPYLREDDAFKSFLEPNSQIVIERDAVPPAPLRWMQAVNETVTPVNSGEMLANFRKESEAVERHIGAVITKARQYSTRMLDMGIATGDLAAVTVQFSESETNEIDVLNSLSGKELSGDAASNSVPNVLSRMANLLNSQLGSLATTPDAVNMCFVEALEYESAQMADFNILVKCVDKIVTDNDKSEKGLHSLKTKSTAKMTPQKIEQHNEAIEVTEKLVAEAKIYLDLYIRALCRVTMPAVTAERRERMKGLSLAFASIVKSIAEHSVKACDTFFGAMKIEDGGAMSKLSVSTVMGNLSLPPLPEGGDSKPEKAAYRAQSVSVGRKSEDVSRSSTSRWSSGGGEKPPEAPEKELVGHEV